MSPLTTVPSYYESDETVELTVGEELSAGAFITVKLTYTGKLKNDLAGFYQSHYTTDDGVEHHIAVTSMEPTYARQVPTLQA